MNLNYNILWVEDTDESFETLSRRTQNYIVKKNLRCHIDRFKTRESLDLSLIDLNNYDLLIIDYKLGDQLIGQEIIKEIRNRSFFNDVMFYSSEGEEVLLETLLSNKIDGVFISDRVNRLFIPKIQLIIDKTLKKSVDVINIRGIMMDATSELDFDIKDIITMALGLLETADLGKLKKYIVNDLIKERDTTFKKFISEYSIDNEWEISAILENRELSSSMVARLLNKILQFEYEHFNTIRETYFANIAEDKTSNKVLFFKEYEKRIINFRNKLAHMKFSTESDGPILIGKVNDVDYYLTEEFCSLIRQNLIMYQEFFKQVQDKIESI